MICYILALAMILPLGSMAVTPMNEQFVAPDYVEPYIDGLGNSSLSIEIDHITGERLNILIDVYKRQERYARADRRAQLRHGDA